MELSFVKHNVLQQRVGKLLNNSCALRLDSTTNSVGFDFKEKYSSNLCETWQAGSFLRIHPFYKLFFVTKSHDSHLPCNGQHASVKMRNTQ